MQLRTGVDEVSGALLRLPALAERVGWAADLVSGMAAVLLDAHWNAADVDALASGEDDAGRKLPPNAWMALRRLGWAAVPPLGVRVNDRIVRMAQEQVGRALRSMKWRMDVTAGVLATWPAEPGRRAADEWDAVRGVVPGGRDLPAGVIDARTRQIVTFLREHDRLPTDVFEIERRPRTARMLLLAACDGQQATMERSEEPTRALLRLQLPTRRDPRSYQDWTWVSCPLPLPPTVPTSAVLHLPTLRPYQGGVRVDLAYTYAVPKAHRIGHVVALGVDWGLNTLLSAGAVRLHGDGSINAVGAGSMFRAAGVLAKQHRLRRLSEGLSAKAHRYQRLEAGGALPALAAKHAALRAELAHLSARRSNLNDALARSAARWAVDQAITAGASVIYVEDLRSMEARGMGRTMNTRLSQQVRGRIVDRIRGAAAEMGIAVVGVPARNTSRHCPRCLALLRHRKAPDKPTTPGWKWAFCPDCGWQGDRDQGAWQRIAARGLTHQATTATDRTTGRMGIPAIVAACEADAIITPAAPENARADRAKAGSTRRRTARPAPGRRGAPSSTGPEGSVDRRPEGHVHKDRRRLPRAAHRHQGVTTMGEVPTTGRHRPRGAALGAGFHLHAHATAPRWEIPLPEHTPGAGTLSRSVTPTITPAGGVPGRGVP
ncbi:MULTISPECIES: zinc ribbon domain-containing protein [unclassified Streptomyces]|uniref:zinc ribbon domain-containing protein n=1 Tax=unclassified Streptomyces TaxID=2593676 RepID=UPI003660220F